MIIYLYFSFIRFNVLNVTAVTKPFKASPAIVNIYLSYPLHIRGKVLGFETFSEADQEAFGHSEMDFVSYVILVYG